MRKKYENLLTAEKDVQRYKRENDEKSNIFQNMIVDFRDKVTKVFNNFQEIMQIKKGILLLIFVVDSNIELPLKESVSYLMQFNSESPFKFQNERVLKQYARIGFHDQLIQALKDIDTVIEIQKTLIREVPNSDEHRLLKVVKDQWTSHQHSSLSNQSLLIITNKKLEKMEWIKRVLDTESKFLEEEKKWIKNEKQRMIENKTRGLDSKPNFIGTFTSESFDFMDSSLK